MDKVLTGFVVGVIIVVLLFFVVLPAVIFDIKSFEIEGVSGIRIYKLGSDTIWIEQPEEKRYICFETYFDNLEKQQGKATAELMKVKIKTAAGWYDN